MLSSNSRASEGSSTGVLPRFTLWRGPRTEAAGLTGMTWPVTSQSNRCLIAARRCFAVGADRSRPQLLDIGRDVQRLSSATARRLRSRTNRRIPRGARIGAARVRVADLGGEEFEETKGGSRAGGGDYRQGREKSDGRELI